MVVRFVAKVQMDNMASKTLFPVEESSDERVALLTGIVQLVSAALQQNIESARNENDLNYMKSDRGVVGYFELAGILFICEADTEKETGNILELIRQNASCNETELSQKIEKALRKRGREISSLWG